MYYIYPTLNVQIFVISPASEEILYLWNKITRVGATINCVDIATGQMSQSSSQ